MWMGVWEGLYYDTVQQLQPVVSNDVAKNGDRRFSLTFETEGGCKTLPAIFIKDNQVPCYTLFTLPMFPNNDMCLQSVS